MRYFFFVGSRYTLIYTSIDVSGFIDSIHDDNEHQAKSDEYENRQEHMKNHIQQDSHSEIIANYRYNCESISKLSPITDALFGVFPGIHQIRTIWIKETRQGAETLSKENKIISLR